MNQDTLTGVVDRIIYHSPDNGFSVFVLQINAKNTALIRGNLHSIQPGEQVCIQGSWVMHPKFGKQFEAKQCTASLPT